LNVQAAILAFGNDLAVSEVLAAYVVVDKSLPPIEIIGGVVAV